MTEDRRDTEVSAPQATAHADAQPATVWMNYRWAPRWYEASKREAETEGMEARPREIVLAVLFWNSYFYEWVLTDALRGTEDRFARVSKWMASGTNPERVASPREASVVTQRLYDEGLLTVLPNYDEEHEREWGRLLDYRDGVEHAKSSRPTSSSRTELPRPVPSPDDLQEMRAGWALGVVIRRIEGLHEVTNTELPPWVDNAG